MSTDSHSLQALQGLDEVQSYVLLRRWLLRNPDELVGGVLLPAQRAALAAEYALERLCLLKCLEGLLLHHYATAGGDGGVRPGTEQARVLRGARWWCRMLSTCLRSPAGGGGGGGVSLVPQLLAIQASC